jgi:hypothetical protein
MQVLDYFSVTLDLGQAFQVGAVVQSLDEDGDRKVDVTELARLSAGAGCVWRTPALVRPHAF